MDDRSELPLICPKCHQSTVKAVRWVQENTFFTCDYCSSSVLIDKDAAMKLLVEISDDRPEAGRV